MTATSTSPDAGASRHAMAVTLPSDCEVAVTRTFDAPRRLVWAANTVPAHLQRWLLGPDGWTMPVCEVDLRVGGAWRYEWAKPGETGFGFGGEYLEVVPEERLVYTESPAAGMPPAVVTMRLDEVDGRTVLTQTMRFADRASRDAAIRTGMNDGVAASYDRLDGVLAAIA
ncbi:MAG: SRPBCC domain-containing protein [Gemmatirosa sp.]|nr:SRPBCC domain-containing protein [Gemmatirosa sp.]